jgi:hypothetical protein
MSDRGQSKTRDDLVRITAAIQAIRDVRTLLEAMQWQRAGHIADLLLDQLAYDLSRRREGRSPTTHDIFATGHHRTSVPKSAKQSAPRTNS